MVNAKRELDVTPREGENESEIVNGSVQTNLNGNTRDDVIVNMEMDMDMNVNMNMNVILNMLSEVKTRVKVAMNQKTNWK
jgi:hypothetical protein